MTTVAEDLYERLSQKSRSQKQRSLKIVHTICREQIERGSSDFSIAMIGGLSESRGGPTTQSMRNKGGSDYRALIEAWLNLANKKNSGSHRRETPGITLKEQLLNKISDPVVRAEVGILMAEIKKLRGENLLLKKLSNNKIVLDQRQVFQATTDVESLSCFDLSDMERVAIQSAIDDSFIASQGWKHLSRGEIVTGTGQQIYKKGYLSAIKKVLAYK